MGHRINGFIGARAELAALADKLHMRKPTRLRQHLGFLPLPDHELDRIFPPPQSYGRHQLSYLSDALLELLVDASRGGKLAYIETEYFAGIGEQGAVAARDGVIVLDPARGTGAINSALRVLGATTSGARDEFESVGLDRLRDNDDRDVID